MVDRFLGSLLARAVDTENPFPGKITNINESTPMQVGFIEKSLLNVSSSLLKEIYEILLPDEVGDPTELKKYIDEVYNAQGRTKELKEDSMKNELETLQQNGIVALYPDSTALEGFQRAFHKAQHENVLKWKNKGVKFDPSRSRSQLNQLSPLVQMLQDTGILTPYIVKLIQQYVEGEDVACVSALFVSNRVQEDEAVAIQTLHWDNYVAVQGEVVLALDVGGADLNTRYYMGSHLCKPNANNAMDSQTGKIARALKNEPHYDEREDQQLRHSLARLLTMLIKCSQANKPLKYIEAHCPMALFDAGGLHSGGATTSTNDRLFLTFRSAHFRRELKSYLKNNQRGIIDNWYPQSPVFFNSLGRVTNGKRARAAS